MLTSIIEHAESSSHSSPVAALRDRLERLTASHQRMVRVNSYVRNRNTRGLKEMGYSDEHVAKLLEGVKPHLGGGFFPKYKLDNGAAKIRTVRAELSAAELANGEMPGCVETGTYTYRHDALSVSFRFLAKPDKAARAILRRYGFVRSNGDFAYSREWSSPALHAAAAVRQYLDA